MTLWPVYPQIMLLQSLLIISLLISKEVEASSTIYSNISHFCKNNGFNFITATNYGALDQKELLKASKAFHETKLRFRILPFDKIDSEMKFHLDDFIVISKGPQSPETFQLEMKAIQKRRVQKSLLLIPNEINEVVLLDELQMITGNAFFYVAYPSEDVVKFKQVIILSNNSRASVTDVTFNQFGHIIENYNLNVSFDDSVARR